MLGQNIFSPIDEEELDLLGLFAKDYESWELQPLAKEVDEYDPNLFTLFQPSEFFDADSLNQQNVQGNPIVSGDTLNPVMAGTGDAPGNPPSLWPQLPLFDFYEMELHAGNESIPLLGGGIFENELFAAQLDRNLLGESLLSDLPGTPPLLFSESARESASNIKDHLQKQEESAAEQAIPQADTTQVKTVKAEEQPTQRKRGKRSNTGSSDQPARRSPRLAARGK